MFSIFGHVHRFGVTNVGTDWIQLASPSVLNTRARALIVDNENARAKVIFQYHL